MIQEQRHDQILGYLADHEFLSVEDAIHLTRTSPATVRRDFRVLAERELVQRTRGGIRRSRNAANGMTPFALREIRNAREKAALARRAATLLSPGDVLIVDGGTTTFHLAGYLPSFPLRLVTNSLRLAAVLGEKRTGESSVEVFLTGGYLYPQSSLLIGPQARASLSQYHAHWAFLSAGGINEEGIYNTNELVVETERTMMENVNQVVILADHSKIGTRAMCYLCGIEKVDMLITDTWPENEPILERFRESGLEVITVDV